MASAHQQPPLDVKAFDAMVQEYAELDAKREAVIKQSRDVQKAAKQAVYASLRADPKKARDLIAKAIAGANDILPIVNDAATHTGGFPSLRMGSFGGSLEELAEAMLFAHYIECKSIATPSQLNESFAASASSKNLATPPVSLTSEEYLGGLLDMTGELQRYSIARATERDIEEVKRCKLAVEAIFEQFLQFDLRNGALRKKYDGLKYTLKKMEATCYELSLASSGSAAGIATAATAAEGAPAHQADGEE